jgi:TonB-linked SusC/RagA family outer membrane protein
MKKTLILLLEILLTVFVYGQQVNKDFKNTPLKSVLAEIESQTGFSIIYERKIINEEKPVTASFKNASIENVLSKILDQTLDFSIQDRMIVIFPKPETKEDPFSLKRISGIVKDQKIEKLLDEVVVVGYGTLKKSDVTGSVTSVKSDELLSAPVAGTAQALQGRAAGVDVRNSSGVPSGDAVIRIRGTNSLTYGNDPLIIIDGVQGGNLNNLNPNDIESMEIVKDAAASSIYGSRGANGIILITTKNGKSGIPRVSYNAYLSSDRVRRKLPSLNATEYATLFDEARRENGLNPLFTADEINRLGNGTNWQDAIFRTGFTQNHNLSVSGSKENLSYFISGGLLEKEGIVIHTGYKQYTLRSNLKIQASNKISFGINTFLSNDERNYGDYSQAISSALQWSPTKAIYDSNSAGGYTQPGGGVGPNSLYNPVGYAKEIKDDQWNTSFSVAPAAEYKITDYLKISSLFVYRVDNSISGYFDNQVVNNGPLSNTSGSSMQGKHVYLQNTNVLSIDKKFGNHRISFTGVYELLKEQYRSTEASAKGIPVHLGYDGLLFGSELQPPYTQLTKKAMRSLMGRINYGYKNRYLLSFSDRYDGASQLAEGHKFDNFAAVSAGWNIREEPFMKPYMKFMPELKLRGSYGIAGNAAVPAYSSHMKFDAGFDANNNPMLTIVQLENKNLKWERTVEANMAMDAKLFDGRLNLTIEYYDKKTKDLLMWQKVPDIIGVESILTNVGSVSNRGVDFSIGGIPVSMDNFTWNTNFTFNHNKNKILALDAFSSTLIYTDADYPGIAGSFVQRVGQPIGTFLGYEFAGVWKTHESSTAALYGAKPGDCKYVDQNKDRKIDKDDIVIIGNAQPKFTFGWNNTFIYSNFNLNIFWQGVYGNKVYNQNRIRRESYTSDAQPTSPEIKQHWTPEKQSDIPAFSGFEYLNSSRWVEDGSYLRLKNIVLGYRLPKKLLTKLKYISSTRLYVSASNLLTITNYTGFDPEASLGKDAGALGVDRGIYPLSKSFVFGVDITFN